jgi:O-methyltransferase
MDLTPNKAKSAIKKVLFRLPLPQLDFINTVRAFGEYSKWTKAHLHSCPHFDNRRDLYSFLQTNYIARVPVDYLEFGVYKGTTLSLWTEFNSHPDSHFYGFDSFEGLPEDWKGLTFKVRKGVFNVNGQVPETLDTRVKFVKGWFQDSLPPFLEAEPLKQQLVVNCDADLYSSTMFVLSKLDSNLVRNSIVIFDEFDGVTHEFRAFQDYINVYKRSLTPIASAGPFHSQIAFIVQE